MHNANMYTQTQINLKYTDLNFSHMKRTSVGIKIKLNRNSINPVIPTELKVENARKPITE